MALLQDILGQLGDMGFGTGGQLGYEDISTLTPENIAGNLRSYFNLGQADLPAHMFQGISSDLLQQGLGKTYSPQIQAGGSSLLSNLQQTLGGQQGKQAMGGFAGSGQASRFQQGAKDVYGKGMSDVLTKVGSQRAQGLQSVQDIINQWKDTAMGIQY